MAGAGGRAQKLVCEERLCRIPCGKPLAFRLVRDSLGGFAARGEASPFISDERKAGGFPHGRRQSRKEQRRRQSREKNRRGGKAAKDLARTKPTPTHHNCASQRTVCAAASRTPQNKEAESDPLSVTIAKLAGRSSSRKRAAPLFACRRSEENPPPD